MTLANTLKIFHRYLSYLTFFSSFKCGFILAIFKQHSYFANKVSATQTIEYQFAPIEAVTICGGGALQDVGNVISNLAFSIKNTFSADFVNDAARKSSTIAGALISPNADKQEILMGKPATLDNTALISKVPLSFELLFSWSDLNWLTDWPNFISSPLACWVLPEPLVSRTFSSKTEKR